MFVIHIKSNIEWYGYFYWLLNDICIVLSLWMKWISLLLFIHRQSHWKLSKHVSQCYIKCVIKLEIPQTKKFKIQNEQRNRKHYTYIMRYNIFHFYPCIHADILFATEAKFCYHFYKTKKYYSNETEEKKQNAVYAMGYTLVCIDPISSHTFPISTS